MYTRIIDEYLKTGQSFFLFGPRATAKMTWLKAIFPYGYLDVFVRPPLTRIVLKAAARLTNYRRTTAIC